MARATEAVLDEVDVHQIELQQQAANLLGRNPQELAEWCVNRIREDGHIDAEVPLEQLDVEGVPLDPGNVGDLVDKLNTHAQEWGGTGQRDPAVACDVPGEALYVADGFHRYEAQRQRGEARLHLTIEPSQTYAEVVKRRLEYAAAHKSIEFARQVDWMQSAWERTEWSDKIQNLLTAFRAVKANYADHLTEDALDAVDGLSDKEYKEMCDWVKSTTKEWGYKTPDEIRQQLAQAEGFNPELLKDIWQKSGKPPEGRFGLGHVEAITNVYSGEYDIQKEVLTIVTDNQLTAEQTAILVDKIEDGCPMEASDVQAIVQNIDIDDIKFATRAKARQTSSSKPKSSVKSVEKLTDEELLGALGERLSKMRSAAMRGGEWSDAEFQASLEVTVGLVGVLSSYTRTRKSGFDGAKLFETALGLEDLAQDLGSLCLNESAGGVVLPENAKLGVDGLIEVETPETVKAREEMLAYLKVEREDIPRIVTKLDVQRAKEVLATKGLTNRKRKEAFQAAIDEAEERIHERQERRRGGRWRS